MKIGTFYTDKSVKLADSFYITVRNTQWQDKWDKLARLAGNEEMSLKYMDDSQFELQDVIGEDSEELTLTCTGVEIPTYGFREEKQKYGNLTQNFILPDYGSMTPLKIRLFETVDRRVEKLLHFLMRRSIRHLNSAYPEYVYNGWMDSLDIHILANGLDHEVMRYHFEKLRLIDYQIFSLNYNSDELAEYALTLSFDRFIKYSMEEGDEDHTLDEWISGDAKWDNAETSSDMFKTNIQMATKLTKEEKAERNKFRSAKRPPAKEKKTATQAGAKQTPAKPAAQAGGPATSDGKGGAASPTLQKRPGT